MSDQPPLGAVPRPGAARSRRLRIIAAAVFVAALILLLSLRSIASFYTDFLWFDSLGYSSVWRGVLFAQVGLAVVAILIMFALLWVNLTIADRLAPTFRPSGPEEELIRRYHETVGQRPRLVRFGVSALFAIFLGASVGARWNDWILFRNRQDFGIDDEQFGIDVGFYVFQLPFIRFVITWFFTAFMVVLVLTAAAHYLNGGIRMNAARERVTAPVKSHLSVLLAVLAIIKAIDYWYQRYELNFSTRGIVDGAGAADVNANLPAIQLLILISIAAAILLILNIRRRGWVLPVVAVGLWAFIAVVVGSIYPAVYQRFVVEPSESSAEEEFIRRNIAATREAYGLTVAASDGTVAHDVDEATFNPSFDDISAELFLANQDTIQNARLIDPAIVSPTFARREADRDQFKFSDDLDVDRYVIDGVERPVVIAARELNLSGVRSGWENQHAAFTHGYGLAMAPANVVDDEGEPEFVVGGLPTSIAEGVDVGLTEGETFQPRIYIGEDQTGYAIVRTNRCEVDFPLQDDGSTSNSEAAEEAQAITDAESAGQTECDNTDGGSNQLFAYDGEDGVRAGGLFRRIAFALRFQDLNPIFSDLIEDDSRFIYNRDVRQRARELAPFLEFDADSYPAIVDGRIVFIIDAYTTSSNFPYSQQADRSSLPGRSDLRQNHNYVRNSVKVAVDAYNGTVDFYIVDPDDPLIRAYQQAFPDLFREREEIPAELSDHFRYPEDMFRIQTNMWATYQLDRPSDFFDDTAAWTVAEDPGSSLESAGNTTQTNADGLLVTSTGERIDPYYVQMELPGEDGQEFVLYRPFVPRARSGETIRQELTAFMVGRTDENGVHSLVSYDVPGTVIDGPVLASVVMLNNTRVAERTTLLGSQGSSVQLGNTLLLPLEDTDGTDRLLYVRPLYVDGGNSGLPLARLVIVAYNTEVRMCPTLEQALGALLIPEEDVDEDCTEVVSPFAGSAPAVIDTPDPGDDGDGDQTGDGGTVTPPSTEVETVLADAAAAFDEAEQALAEGDLGLYQDKIAEAEALLDQALDLLDG